MTATIVRFNTIPDARGRFIVAQIGGGLPFEARRFFTVFEAGWGADRGGRAHRYQSHLLISHVSRITVVSDDGYKPQKFVLDSEEYGLLIPPMNWWHMRMERGAFLLAMCSGEWDEKDYIRNRSEFDEMTKVAA